MSGRILGAHQKLDRVAHARLKELIGSDASFPPIRQILHFEGRKGPDAIKRKSPAKDEPWHYYSPFDDDDSQLLDLLTDHYKQLVKELKGGNTERAAFEAAWLAHAIVDGLTPAHHYPYEDKLSEIRGAGKETRTTVREKLVPKGENAKDTVRKSWKVYGPRGLMTTHGMFEMGVATIIAPLSMVNALPTEEEVAKALEIGHREVFKRAAREIAVLELYDKFRKRGWALKVVMDVRGKLAPTIAKTLTLVWYCAYKEAHPKGKE